MLVLYGFSVREAFVELEELKTTVRSHASMPVNFYVEYLESERFGSAGYQKALSETIRRSYSDKQIDLVVVSPYPALRFAIDNRDQTFPGVPIVFVGVAPNRLQGGVQWRGVTGVMTNVDVRGSLDLALRLHPDTKSVALIAGKSEFETFWLGAVRDEVGQRQEKLRLIEIPTESTKYLLEEVSRLPSHTIVFFNLVPQESSHAEIGTYDVLAAVAQRFPTYCVHDYCLDHGAIGGSYTDPSIAAVMGGYMAARVLSGEKPENIPVSQDSVAHPRVDWRQLRRWNIPESALPPGTVVLYRQPTVWERYEKYVVAGIVLIVMQALLILGLLWQRARKRKTEAILRESEKRFRVMANTTPSLVWMSDKEGNVIYLNDRQTDFTGHDPNAGFADTWTGFVHPDDLENVLTANAQAMQQRERFSKEYRLRRRDGVYRWMLDVAAPRINGDGKFAGFIGSAHDVTDQKLAQEALERVGGRLIEAQEKERSRIARELHDDICQRLAMVTLELEQASEGANGSTSRLRKITQRYGEIALDLQSLSHELHSSKLEYLGIVSALRTFCEEISDQQSVDIDFVHHNVPGQLPREVSLCLFRIAQEALHNAVKYSGTRHFTVHLLGASDTIQLEIRDEGAGFDVKDAKQGRGLGLMSMQERVQLVNGVLAIKSKSNRGTSVIARVPVAAPGNTERDERI